MATFSRKCINLSHPLTSSTKIYPSDPEFCCKPHALHSTDGYSVHKLSLGTHTGTHIDAPYHFYPGGRTVDQIPLEELIGEFIIVDLSTRKPALQPKERLTWDYFKTYEPVMFPGRILLINTGWSKSHYQSAAYFNHPYLAPSVATEIIARGIKVVGIDTLNPDETPSSVTTEGPDGFGFHEAFLGAGGTIAENLTNLEEVIKEQGHADNGERWIVNVVPLLLSGLDGSPVRAFAVQLPI